MRTVAILCAQERTIYGSVPGCEIYDRKRDAWTFAGGMPVVAHPPCRLWSKLSQFARSENPSLEIALGMRCADHVKACGGILEHPAYSRLFEAARLPRPGCRGAGGFTLSVPQYWFGHQGRKDTWLFVVGIEPRELPEIPIRLLSPDRRPVEDLSKRQREATPEAFAHWLVLAARQSMPAAQPSLENQKIESYA